jgi:phosphate-induced protein 1
MKSISGKVRYALTFLFVILAANLLLAQKVREPQTNPGERMVPNGDGSAVVVPVPEEEAGPVGLAVVTGNGINYNGGPVLKSSSVPIYLIWYGNWNGTGSNTQATVTLVEHYLNSLGGTPYELINSTYGDTTGNVSGGVHVGGAIFDTGSQGTRLTNSRLTSIVTRSLSNGLPTDANGVYMVLTSSNVSEQGFCTSFCGFHTHQTINSTDIKWGFVGNPDRCPSGCEIQTTGPNSPSANVGGADGLINVLTHEQEEAISDPDLNAWFDSSGQENADKCNFNFGTTSTCAAGSLCTAAGNAARAKFNQTFGNNDWMIQQNWENAAGGKCVQHK